jgi:o-succinylbenzoate synthase
MLKLEYTNYTLDFKFDAGTSRGVLKQHPIYILKISIDGLMPFGFGEAAPLERLSVDRFEDLDEELARVAHEIAHCNAPKSHEEVYALVETLVAVNFPSVRFALETALLDWLHGGKQQIFKNDFYLGKKEIPINGLIWMGTSEQMREQVDEKLAYGFKCIKIKVGAIDWAKELDLIKYLRSKSRAVIIRLDANGGFRTNDVFSRLADLEPLRIHSIEQPIAPRQPEAMNLICEKSKIDIALDEDLIGLHTKAERKALLTYIKPAYIILKPTLLGGFKATSEWIALAEELGIAWWITSALESNIGLNAISQFAAEYSKLSYQGLGTGQLYHNNIKSPLTITGEQLSYSQHVGWDIRY